MTEHHKLFICSCGDIAHQLVMSYYDDEDDKEVYCTVHLNPERNIFKRIIAAVKYIFGHKSIYGEFDEFIFKPSDADKLQEVIDHLRDTDKHEK